MDVLKGLDWGTYYFFRAQTLDHPEIVAPMRIFEHMGSLAVTSILVGLALALTLIGRRGKQAILTLVSFGLALGLAEGSRVLIERPRPEDAQNSVSTFEMQHSFPARGLLLFTTASLLLLFAVQSLTTRRGVRLACYLATSLLIVAVALSQFVLTLHFLTDVLGGLFGGFACALIVKALQPVKI